MSAIQLPDDNFESLSLHELTYSFVEGHDGAFWAKFRQLAGQRLYDLDITHHSHNKWPILKL